MTKYHSTWTVCRKGHKHQSKREADACGVLDLLEHARKVKDIKYQPEFTLQEGFRGLNGKKVRPITYTADFSFYDKEQRKFRVVDVKGFSPPVFALKRKMFDYKMKDQGIMLEEVI